MSSYDWTEHDLKKYHQQTMKLRADLKKYQKDVAIMPTTGDPPSPYLDPNAFQGWKPTWNTQTTSHAYVETEEDGLDPDRVDWDQLMTLYQDDPLLMAIFNGLKEYFLGEAPFPSLGQPSGGSYSPYLSGVTTSTGSSSTVSTINPPNTTTHITSPFTLTYDNDGNAKLEADLSGAPSQTATVTWRLEDE